MVGRVAHFFFICFIKRKYVASDAEFEGLSGRGCESVHRAVLLND